MIIWRGRGILVLVFTAAALIFTQLFFDGAYGKGYYSTHGFAQFVAGVAAAVPIWLLGKKWNDESDRRHDLFFIPMQYWSFIILGRPVVVASAIPTTPPPPRAAEPAPAQSLERPAGEGVSNRPIRRQGARLQAGGRLQGVVFDA